MDMSETKVLCAANSYEGKYYFNPEFDSIPEPVKKELRIICILFTEDVGGVITMSFDGDGELLIETDAAEEDILYDEIGAGLLVKEIQKNRKELLESLETYYRVKAAGGIR